MDTLTLEPETNTELAQLDALLAETGPKEPPADPRIYNRRQPDGTFPSVAAFFDQAAANLTPTAEWQAAKARYQARLAAVLADNARMARDVREAKWEAAEGI